MKGYIFDTKHFAVHDGTGIRTTIFFKGCPLKCVWCHNPEGIMNKQQMGYLAHKCVNCGECVSVCPTGAHYLTGEHVHQFERSNCILCGACIVACTSNALSLYGRYVDVDTLVKEILEDKDFYECSNGGVTLSGGECLLQDDFCAELLKTLKEHNIHTAVDTCGFVSKDAIDKVMPYTDIFLYDVKAFDEETHIKCTGHSNKVILENLKYIDKCGKNIEIRIPYVPGYNSDQIEKIGKFLTALEHVSKVKVLPYHNYAGTKYKSLDMENTLPGIMPSDEEIGAAQAIIREFGIATV